MAKIPIFALVLLCFVPYCVPEKLKVTLIFEGLCPYCHEFIVNQLYPGYQKLGDRLELDLIPLGNAWYTVNGSETYWNCQHGPVECYINKLIACNIYLSPSQSTIMEFLNCLIKNSNRTNSYNIEEELAKQCSLQNNINWDQIQTCLKTKADKLELNYAKRQKNLRPPLSYVPNIRFNDKFDANIENSARDDFLKTACGLFKMHPKVCYKNSITNFEIGKIEPKRCYANDFGEVFNP